ncbi:hypothetical protein [Pasteurella phage vB_PmuP_PHB02]|uniref:Uncharacterized protein n=1 Tax=Pasteurella phage vB_PmuP_PHB02 TaxID=2005054 RepID=A0A1Y0T1E1_9CAUD|nr:hypothetical protein HOR82_gp45 [Pasteurella phage vB_PmuP_PHB02]ARV77609.1 hypothetical protein [Pasteurella phage vB_PmuP_PHB02]
MVNLFLQAHYDDVLSDIYLDDFLSGGDGTHVLFQHYKYCVIFEDEKTSRQPFFKEYKLNRMKKEDLWGLVEKLDLPHYSGEDMADYTKSDIIDELMSISNEEYYERVYDNLDYYELDYDFTVHGYNQGDVLKVVLVGSKEFIKNSYYTRDYLQHLFFDSPIRAMLSVTTDESVDYIDLTEYLKDSYTYDKEVLLSNFESTYEDEYKEQILNYLKINLPTELEYL